MPDETRVVYGLLSDVCMHVHLQFDILFNSLLHICKDPSCSWQHHEGAVMGLTALLHGFEYHALHPSRSTNTVPPVSTAFSLAALPGRISSGGFKAGKDHSHDAPAMGLGGVESSQSSWKDDGMPLWFGGTMVERLPDVVTTHLPNALFALLAHEQLRYASSDLSSSSASSSTSSSSSSSFIFHLSSFTFIVIVTAIFIVIVVAHFRASNSWVHAAL
jgi:hypothetical protein